MWRPCSGLVNDIPSLRHILRAIGPFGTPCRDINEGMLRPASWFAPSDESGLPLMAIGALLTLA